MSPDDDPRNRPDRESEIVAALRRIMRAVDLHSRRLLDDHGLTAPQLAVLRELERAGPSSPAALASAVHLARGTLTGILARLERRGLAAREPSPVDRRSVVISLTDLGRGVLERAPSLLQERFRSELERLEDWEQMLLLSTLQRIASMMDASHLDAAPHLVVRAEDLQAEPPPTPERGSPPDPVPRRGSR